MAQLKKKKRGSQNEDQEKVSYNLVISSKVSKYSEW